MNSPVSTPFRFPVLRSGIFVLLLLLAVVPAVLAESNSTVLSHASEKTVTLYLFESSTCVHCANAEETIHELMAKYPAVRLVDMEVSANETNRRLFELVSQKFGIADPGVPMLLVGNKVLLGDVEIRKNLEAILLDEERNAGLSENGTGPVVPTGSEPVVRITAITIPLVLAAAFADGLNPCALAVLVFLIVTILAVGDRRKALDCGFAYTLAIFILYFLAGLGIFAGIRSSGLAKEIYLLAAGIAIVAGILSLRDAFSEGNPPLLRIPAAAGGLIKKYAESASVPASFILGLLVGLFEMPCTGAIYFSVLNLISSSMTFAEGLSYLVLYNMIFILPLIIVIVAVYYGLPVKDAEGWRARNMRRLRLVSGVVLLVTGIVMLVFLR
ncbi:MAG: cytochrome c biogenesis protein [Methanoregulaceae archaeon]